VRRAVASRGAACPGTVHRCRRSTTAAGGAAILPYAYGYRDPPHLRDVMAYACSAISCWVNQTPAPSSADVSAIIRTRDSAGIIVERSMYLRTGDRTFGAGHSSVGIGAPASRWYFAEGATGAYFDTFILVANPGPDPVTVNATYLSSSGATVHRRHVPLVEGENAVAARYDVIRHGTGVNKHLHVEPR
jgi:hypothetical protein